MTVAEDKGEQREEVRDPEVVEPVLDLYLRLFLEYLEQQKEGEAGFSITLVTSGGVVSGTAVTRAAYLKGIDVSLRSAGGNGGEPAAEFFSRMIEHLDSMPVPEQGHQFPRWIHLQDARVVAGDQTLRFPQWRGRLADVAGWSFGFVSEA